MISVHAGSGSKIVGKVQYGFVDRNMDFQYTYENGESDASVYPGKCDDFSVIKILKVLLNFIHPTFVGHVDGIPPDGSPETVIHTYDTGLIATYYTFATFGTVFAVGCLLFNFAFKGKK